MTSRYLLGRFVLIVAALVKEPGRYLFCLHVIRVVSIGSARKFGQSLIPVQPFTMMVAGIIKCRPFLDEFLIHTIEQVVQSFFESFYGLLHLGSTSLQISASQ